MCGNMNNIPVGKCSQCGGVVSVPRVWMSVNRPIPRCERCGGYADEAANLPTIKTAGGYGYTDMRAEETSVGLVSKKLHKQSCYNKVFGGVWLKMLRRDN